MWISRAECAGLIEATPTLTRPFSQRMISRAECAGLIEATTTPRPRKRTYWISRAECAGLIEASYSTADWRIGIRFPALNARASLKLDRIRIGPVKGTRFPALNARASLKPSTGTAFRKTPGRISRAECAGLIEAEEVRQLMVSLVEISRAECAGLIEARPVRGP